MTASANTGTMEMRHSYQKHLQSGLVTAGMIHMMIVGALTLNSTDEEQFDHIVCRFPIIENSVTFRDFSFRPLLQPKIVVNTAGVGTPIPIPDPEFNPERSIPVEEQTGSAAGTNDGTDEGIGTGAGSGDGIITGGVDEEIPPNEFTPGVEKYPAVIANPSPLYPDIARRSGIEGTVHIKMWVTKEGIVKTAEVVKSTSEVFDQAAIDAAKLWKFTPAIMNSRPVSVFVTVPFKFRLRMG